MYPQQQPFFSPVFGKYILNLWQVYSLVLANKFLNFGNCISVFIFKCFLDCNSSVVHSKCVPNISLSSLLFLASVFSFVGKCILNLWQVYFLVLENKFLNFGNHISVLVFNNVLDCNCSVGHSECIPDSSLCFLLFLAIVFLIFSKCTPNFWQLYS